MNSYNGGKNGHGTYQQLINFIPPHNIYVAPFAGHDGIFRNIKKAPLSILSDLDPEICLYWKRLKSKTYVVVENFIQGTLFEKPKIPVVILRSNDYTFILQKFHNNPEAFIYCDPPYPMETRKSKKRIYRYDWTHTHEHIHFLEKIKQCKCNVMVSSYENELYNIWLEGWHTHKFYSTTRSGERREEIIYMNYPKPMILHDFSFIGKDYRERENIKDKLKRFKQKLKGLPEHERTAMLSMIIQEYRTTAGILIKESI